MLTDRLVSTKIMRRRLELRDCLVSHVGFESGPKFFEGEYMFTKKFAWLRLVVAATYVLSACSVQPEAKTVVQTVEVEKIVEVEKTVEKVVTSEPVAAAVMQDGDKWCSGMKIRFFVGGDAGTPFAVIVNEGAIFATRDLGPSVDYVYSGWNNEKMLDQFRDAIAAKVDGIAFMGHAGDDAVMPLAQQACRSWDLDDVPERRCTQGSHKIWWGICRGQLGPARSGVGCRSYPDLGSEKRVGPCSGYWSVGAAWA